MSDFGLVARLAVLWEKKFPNVIRFARKIFLQVTAQNLGKSIFSDFMRLLWDFGFTVISGNSVYTQKKTYRRKCTCIPTARVLPGALNYSNIGLSLISSWGTFLASARLISIFEKPKIVCGRITFPRKVFSRTKLVYCDEISSTAHPYPINIYQSLILSFVIWQQCRGYNEYWKFMFTGVDLLFRLNF